MTHETNGKRPYGAGITFWEPIKLSASGYSKASRLKNVALGCWFTIKGNRHYLYLSISGH